METVLESIIIDKLVATANYKTLGRMLHVRVSGNKIGKIALMIHRFTILPVVGGPKLYRKSNE